MIHKMRVTITTVDWKPKCTILVPAQVDACNRLTNEGYKQCRDAALIAMEDLHAGKTPRFYANRKPKKDTDDKLNMVVYQWEKTY